MFYDDMIFQKEAANSALNFDQSYVVWRKTFPIQILSTLFQYRLH